MDATVMQLILRDQKIFYMLTDRQFIVTNIGEATQRFSGQVIKHIPGQSLLTIVPELLGSESVLAEIVTGQTPHFALSWVNRENPAGQTYYLNFTLLPRTQPDGTIMGLVCLVQDMTEVGEIQQQLAQHHNELRLLQDELTQQNLKLAAANAELQRLADIKSQFVSIAAHELRSPLTSIIGYIELLQEETYGPLLDAQRRCLQIVQGSGNRLQAITRALLDATRIEAGRVELTLAPLNLVDLVNSIVTEFKPQLDTRGQKLVVTAPLDLPYALADEVRTVQIINNLISNAIKYSHDDGQIEIKLQPVENKSYLQFSITDNGLGIAAADQKDLFKRFFRAESALVSKAGGTGLGLYITQALVELHGGRIWLESELNKGSTFYVTFPSAGNQASKR